MVTVQAPKAPCRQTQARVTVGHHGLTAAPRRRSTQVPAARVRISTPTPVAR